MSCRVDWIPLGDLVHFESGGTPSKKFQTYWNGNIPWISAKNSYRRFGCHKQFVHYI